MSKFFSWKREFPLSRFRGSVLFPCYKEPAVEVTLLECQTCPSGCLQGLAGQRLADVLV